MSKKRKASKNKPSKPSFIFLLIISLLPLIGGGKGISIWVENYNNAGASLGWEVAEGVVTKKYVAKNMEADDFSAHATPTFFPQLEYEFIYNGKKHRSKGIDLRNSPASSNADLEKEKLAFLPNVGEKVFVYYDPQSGKTVVFPGAEGTSYAGLIVSCIFLILGLLVLRLAFKFF